MLLSGVWSLGALCAGPWNDNTGLLCNAGMMVEEVARFFDPWGAAEAQQQAMPQGEAIGACWLLPAFLMPTFTEPQDRHNASSVPRFSLLSKYLPNLMLRSHGGYPSH